MNTRSAMTRRAAQVAVLLFLYAVTGQALAQDAPPAPVVTAVAEQGQVLPTTEYVGSFYFPEVSQVATEISGLVESVDVEEGMAVKKGQTMVRLKTDLLRKELEAAEASHQQVLAELENAELAFERVGSLFESKSISEQEYDQSRLSRQALVKQAEALKAQAAKLRLTLQKAAIPAPFDGVLLERQADRGEWLAQGALVGTLARNDVMEAVVEAPQDILAFVRPGQEVEVKSGDTSLAGKVFAIIPSGDVATRTFPVKVRVRNQGTLAQGMEARVWLPTGADIQAVIVPRDAVIQARGQFVVYAVVEGAAKLIPVEVQAYVGLKAAVRGPGLAPGMPVVIKGNERLRPGQAVAPEKPAS